VEEKKKGCNRETDLLKITGNIHHKESEKKKILKERDRRVLEVRTSAPKETHEKSSKPSRRCRRIGGESLASPKRQKQSRRKSLFYGVNHKMELSTADFSTEAHKKIVARGVLGGQNEDEGATPEKV